MKKLLFVLVGFFMATPAMATGFKMTIFKCSSLINGPVYELAQLSTSPPGGPVHTWYEFTQSDMVTSERVTFEVQRNETILTDSHEATLVKFNNYPSEGVGHFNYLKINGRVFIDSTLMSLDGDRQILTQGLQELGSHYLCVFHN